MKHDIYGTYEVYYKNGKEYNSTIKVDPYFI